MKNLKARKLAVAAAAIVVPLAIGWTLTAQSSIGALSGGESGDHTIDVYLIDGYEVERENRDGVVTNVVTGPDGGPVAVADAPPAVRTAIDEWTEPVDLIDFEFDADAVCYRMLHEPEPGEDTEVIVESDGEVTAMRASADGVIEAVFIAGVDDLDALHADIASGAPLVDLPGAVPVSQC